MEKGYEIERRVILSSAIPLQQLRDVLYQRLHLTRPSDLFSMNVADAFASLTSSGNLKEACSFSPKESVYLFLSGYCYN